MECRQLYIVHILNRLLVSLRATLSALMEETSMIKSYSSLIPLEGFRDVAWDYEGAIIDLWGVMHDGITVFPKAIEALEHLRDLGKTVCFLSNAPRRTASVIRSLDEMGIDRGLYQGIVTSGETALVALSGLASSGTFGRRFFHIGPDFLQPVTGDMHLVPASTLCSSDFVLCTGTDRSETIDYLIPLLVEAKSRSLMLACLNPDLTVHIGDREVLCAGAVAQQFELMGGRALYFGKPYGEVYARAFDAIGLDARSVIAIGDGFRTDIKGAAKHDVDSILITNGIHRKEIGNDAAGRPDLVSVERLSIRYAATPTFVMSDFQW